jgi:hypothetical protein
MIGSTSLFYSIYNYAWGGSTAIKKTLFKKLQIEQEWKKGYSDDLILTKTLKKAGYTIRFAPESISESPIEGTIRGFIKWGTRQYTWIRWYYPSAWIFSITSTVALKIATILGVILLAMGYTIPGLLMISTIFFEMISGSAAHAILRRIMQYPKERFGSSVSYALMMPLVFFVLAFNNLASLFKTEIIWGGRTYKKPR